MNKQCFSVLNDDGVLLCGYYKKLKTMKKKFFVLYTDTPCKVARIEYYDSEKKFKSGFTPKRIIKIKNCFNINRRLYTKHDFVIVLASKEGGFGIVMDSEDDMNKWLDQLLQLQRSGENSMDFPQYDYVWQVIIQKKGIAEQQNISGSHHICLTNNSITFIKIGREKNAADKRTAKIEVLLTTIRRCGDSQCFFYMEIGRQSSLGPGELWMETEDPLTAKNMHQMILSKMVSLNEALVEPMRKRSSSATESSNLHHDRKSSQAFDLISNNFFSAQNFCRDRCDSLPSRNRTSSECSSRIVRMTPNITTNRAVNFHASKTSPIAYSASEESVSVDESEESIGMPYLIRSPECVIPEEYSNETPKYQYVKKSIDINSVTAASMGPVIKTNIPHIKQCSTAFDTERNKDICGNIDDELHISSLTPYTGSKYENNIRKEATTNRVRAFSVGSRVKSTRICSKASPKLFNSDSVDCSTKKSLSVPVLINKNFQLPDQMGDLMEIDFSKPTVKTLNKNFHININECQNMFNTQRKKLTFSNSEESIQKNLKKSDNGYLEMRPITLDSNCITSNGNTDFNIPSQEQNIIEEKYHKEDPIANSPENIHDRKSVTSLNDSDNSPQNSLTATDKDSKIKSPSPTSVNNPTLSSTCSLKSNQSDETNLSKDLYYASLDLPKCSDDVDVRYIYQESSSNTSCEELKNEYAKINFIQSDTTQSFTANN